MECPGTAAIPPRPRWTRASWAVLAGLLTHLMTLHCGIVRDDVSIVQNDPRTANLHDLRGLWLTDWWYGQTAADRATRDPLRDRLYRPLPLTTIAAQRALHGLWPFGFHLFNVLLHAAVCGLVNLLVARISGSAVAAGVAGLLFAVHPIHVEPVAEIVGRADLLAAIGVLGGLLLASPARGAASWKAICVSAAAFLAALFSKETAVCYPLLLAAVWWHRRTQGCEAGVPRRLLAQFSVLVLPLAVYFPLRWLALEGQLFRSQAVTSLMNPLQAAEGWMRVYGAAEVLGHYLRLMFWPLRLSSDYSLAVCDPSAGPRAEMMIGFCGAIVAIAAISCWLRDRFFQRSHPAKDRSPETAICLMIVLTATSYALISNTVLLIGVSLAERLFYTPSIFLCGAIGVAIAGILVRIGEVRPSLRIAGGGLAGVTLLLLATRSVLRASDWRTSRDLIENDLTTYPQNARLSYQLATLLAADAESLAGTGRIAVLDRVDAQIAKTLAVAPDYPKAVRLSALAGELRGDRLRAIAGYRRCLELLPDDALARQRLSALEEWLARVEARIASARAELAQSPEKPELHARLADALISGGRSDEALRMVEEASANMPESADVQRVLARVHLDRDLELALSHAIRAERLRPDDALIRMTVAEILDRSGRVTEADEQWKSTLQLLPADDPRRIAIETRLRNPRSSSPSRNHP